MISTVISSLLGRRLLGSTVYEMKLERRGVDWGAVRKPRPLAHVFVRSLMRTPDVVAHAGETVHELAERLHKTDDAFVPVVGLDDAFLGFIALGDLIAHLDTDPDGSIDALVHASPAIFTGEESIERAIPDMLGAESGILPIVDAAGTLRGIVSRRDVLDAYRSLAPAAA
jgi:CBS domain-containing protein